MSPKPKLRSVTPYVSKCRISTIPGDHDYVRALYDAMPSDQIVEQPLMWKRPPADMRLTLFGQADIFHLGWPENFFVPQNLSVADFEAAFLAFIEVVGQSAIKVVWTMHNRLPHYLPHDWGERLYRAWAAIADGVIHHSHWGMKRVHAELPFKASARHAVIPHGHYGVQMPSRHSRSQIEAMLNLPPCTMRFGVLGRAQPEKRVDLILRAFHAAGRPDQQLLVNAVTPDMLIHDDARIIVNNNWNQADWLPRSEIAPLIQSCDALVSAHTGVAYLTSGLVADAVGVGIPMLTPPWEFYREILGEAAFEYDGSESGLSTLFEAITPAQLEAGKQASVALQARYAWPKLAQQTLTLFEQLGLS